LVESGQPFAEVAEVRARGDAAAALNTDSGKQTMVFAGELSDMEAVDE
jgi:hypothetical protein